MKHLKDLTFQQLVIVEAVGGLALFGLAFLVVCQPMLRAIEATKAEIQGVSAKLQSGPVAVEAAQLERVQGALATRQRQWERVQGWESAMAQAMTSPQDPALVVNRLTKAAATHEVELASVKPSESTGGGEPGGPYRHINFEMELQGSYDRLVTFLEELDLAGQPYFVSQLSIEPAQNQDATLKAQATVTALYPAEPKSGPEAPSAGVEPP